MAGQPGGNAETKVASPYRFWTDRAFVLFFLLALLVASSLLGVVLDVYPGLPERLPILFNDQGQADFVASKVALYRLPLSAFLLIVINGMVTAVIVRNNAFATRMLMLTAAWVGLLLLAGLWFIIR